MSNDTIKKLTRMCIKNRNKNFDSILTLNKTDSHNLAVHIFKILSPIDAVYPFYRYYELMSFEEFLSDKEYEKWNRFRGINLQWFGEKTELLNNQTDNSPD